VSESAVSLWWTLIFVTLIFPGARKGFYYDSESSRALHLCPHPVALSGNSRVSRNPGNQLASRDSPPIPQTPSFPMRRFTLSSAEIAVNLTTQTDKNGFFYQVSSGSSCHIRADRGLATGFAIFKQSGLELLVSHAPATSDVKLQLASGTTTVEVAGPRRKPSTTQDATIGNTFDSRPDSCAGHLRGAMAAGVLELAAGRNVCGYKRPMTISTRGNGALKRRGAPTRRISPWTAWTTTSSRVGTAFQGAVRSTLDSIEEFRVTTIGDKRRPGTLLRRTGDADYQERDEHVSRGALRTKPADGDGGNDWFNKQAELSNGLPNVPGKSDPQYIWGNRLADPSRRTRLFFLWHV